VKERQTRVSYPRDRAVQALVGVLSYGKTLEEVLPTDGDPAVNRWLREVVSGTLRWKGRLDQALDSVALKKKPSGSLRKMLLLAAYQLIVQDRTPPAWLVSETVDWIKRREGEAPARFANACLRKLSHHAAAFRDQPWQDGWTSEQAAAWASLPVWLWSALVKDHGLEWAKAFAQATLQRPTLWFQLREAPSAELLEVVTPGSAVPGSFSLQSEVCSAADFLARSEVASGSVLVQDISSQLLVRQMAECVRADPDFSVRTVLDLCAAPGGKAIHLAWLGFQVTATDHHPVRRSLLEANAQRCAPTLQVLPWEALSPVEEASPGVATAPQQWDWVWLDAPCSGMGILRRHPDVKWIRKEKDVQSLNVLQQDLLRQAWQRVKPGGYLSYTVCSVLQSEGPGALAALALGAHSVQTYLLHPAESPFGDGFWGILLRKK
jgi:16S rRNA (cytosine967-C5)-methyltransferase